MKIDDLKPGDQVRYRPNVIEIYTVVEVVPIRPGGGGYALIKNVHGHEVRAKAKDLWRYTAKQ